MYDTNWGTRIPCGSRLIVIQQWAMSHRMSRRLRPDLFSAFKQSACRRGTRCFAHGPQQAENAHRDATNDYRRRVAQLEDARGDLSSCYPRLISGLRDRTSLGSFRSQYEDALNKGETIKGEHVLVAGMPS